MLGLHTVAEHKPTLVCLDGRRCPADAITLPFVLGFDEQFRLWPGRQIIGEADPDAWSVDALDRAVIRVDEAQRPPQGREPATDLFGKQNHIPAPDATQSGTDPPRVRARW